MDYNLFASQALLSSTLKPANMTLQEATKL